MALERLLERLVRLWHQMKKMAEFARAQGSRLIEIEPFENVMHGERSVGKGGAPFGKQGAEGANDQRDEEEYLQQELFEIEHLVP